MARIAPSARQRGWFPNFATNSPGDGHGAANQRSTRIMNGVASEGFPSVGDLEMRDWSGGINRLRFWDDSRTHHPRLSYVMFKTGEPDRSACCCRSGQT